MDKGMELSCSSVPLNLTSEPSSILIPFFRQRSSNSFMTNSWNSQIQSILSNSSCFQGPSESPDGSLACRSYHSNVSNPVLESQSLPSVYSTLLIHSPICSCFTSATSSHSFCLNSSSSSSSSLSSLCVTSGLFLDRCNDDISVCNPLTEIISELQTEDTSQIESELLYDISLSEKNVSPSTILGDPSFSSLFTFHSYLPSLLEVWDQVKKVLVRKRTYIFLDYDGTLTPIVSDPSEAKIDENTRRVLRQLSSIYCVSIVTGRALKTIKNFVQINANHECNLTYAAGHGFHIESCLKKIDHKVGLQFLPDLFKAKSLISCNTQHIDGISLEDNDFAISVHYRNVDECKVMEIEEAIDNVLQSFPYLRKSYGKKVFEVRLNVEWDKGRAILWLMDAMGVNPYSDDVAVLYMGDDLTDEDAFRVIKDFPNGLSVIVASKSELRSKPSKTSAMTQIDDTTNVIYFLNLLVKLHEDEKDSAN